MLSQSAREHGAVRYVGTGENHWAAVHVDDLADLYLRTVEHAPAGTLLNAVDDQPYVLREDRLLRPETLTGPPADATDRKTR
jgi:nucleoside-diphosphate-sugar epimerase